jgi:hypothetical protein
MKSMKMIRSVLKWVLTGSGYGLSLLGHSYFFISASSAYAGEILVPNSGSQVPGDTSGELSNLGQGATNPAPQSPSDEPAITPIQKHECPAGTVAVKISGKTSGMNPDVVKNVDEQCVPDPGKKSHSTAAKKSPKRRRNLSGLKGLKYSDVNP